MGLDDLVETLEKDDFNILKKQFSDKWEYLNKNSSCPHDYFKSIDGYQKPVDKLRKKLFLVI